MKTIPCTCWGSETGKKIPEFIEATLTITADAFSLHDGLPERKSPIRVVIKDKPLSTIDHIIHRPLSGAELAKRIYSETFSSYIISGAGVASLGVGLLWWRSRDEDFSTLIAPAVIIVLIILTGAVAWGWIVASFRTRKDFLEKTETYIMNQAGQVIARLQFTPTDFAQLKEALPETEFKIGSAEPAKVTSSASVPYPKGTAQVRAEDSWTCPNCGEEGNSGYQDVCWRCRQEVEKTEVAEPVSQRETLNNIARSESEQQKTPKQKPGQTLREKDNKGTRQDSENHANTFWGARMLSPKKDPFLLYTFNNEEDARSALLGVPCIHVAKDSGKLICTEILTFGYYVTKQGGYEAIISGDDLTYELWDQAKTSFIRHGGHPRGQGELAPTKYAVSEQSAANAQASEVVFVREDRRNDAVYRIYKAPDSTSAKAFLEQNPVTERLHYIVVETPEGNYCQDIVGMYKE